MPVDEYYGPTPAWLNLTICNCSKSVLKPSQNQVMQGKCGTVLYEGAFLAKKKLLKITVTLSGVGLT